MNRDIAILREVVRKLVPLLSSRGIKVTQQGSQAFVETDARTHIPKRVNIPNIPDSADAPFILAIQGFIDHEIGHVLFTDWKAVSASMRDGNKIGEERGEKLAIIRGQQMYPSGEKLRSLGNIVEDPFVERSMQKKFPGTEWNLDKLYDVFLRRITQPAFVEADSDTQRLNVLLVPLVRAWAGQKRFDGYLTENGYYELPIIKKFCEAVPESVKKQIASAKTSWDCLAAARALFDIMYPPPPPPPPAEKESEEEVDEPSSMEDKGKGSSSSDAESDDAGEGGKSKSKSKEKDDAADAKGDEDVSGAGDDKKDPADASKDEAESDGKPDDESGADGEDVDKASEPGDEAPGAGDADGEDESDDAGSDDGSDGSAGEGEADEDDAADEAEGKPDERPVSETEAKEGDAGEDADDAGGDEAGDGREISSEEGSPEDDDEEEDEEELGRVGDSEDEHAHVEEIDGEGTGSEGEAVHGPGFGDPDFEDVDPVGRDLSAAITKAITDQAVRETRSADYRVFTKDWDVIEPLQVPSHMDVSRTLEELDEKTRHMVAPMQKEIERMMASRSQVIHVPGYRSGRLHGASLHRLTAKDDRVFRRKHDHKSKATAVTLLIDNSGSMSGRSWHCKLPIAMASGYALSQTLERVGIKHEVLGFTTTILGPHRHEQIRKEEALIGKTYTRTEPIYMPIFKGWDERLGTEAKRRFAATIDGAVDLRENVDGESLRNAAERLSTRPEERKVLIVLSDGNPACRTRHYPEVYADLHRAVEEAEKAKIEVIGIGILDEAVRTFYPKHIVLRDLDKLPVAVMGELKRILIGPGSMAA